MNSRIFFLSALLTIGIISIPLAHAELVEQGKNYDKHFLGYDEDGKKKYKTVFPSGLDRIVENWQFVNYIVTEDSNIIQVEGMNGSVVLDKATCGFSFFNDGYISEGETPLLTDSITGKYATYGTDNWFKLNQINDAVCVSSYSGDGNTIEVIAEKSSSVGVMQYVYIYNGINWKTELRVTNTSGLNDKKFGFDQTIDLNRDSINYGGSQRNLDNFDGITFDRTWLENNESKIIKLLNGKNFDFDIGFDNLYSVTVFDTGIESSKLVFDFTYNSGIILDGETLIIDPTYAQTESSDGSINSGGASGAACPSAVASQDTSSRLLMRGTGDSSIASCEGSFVQFDTSSITPGSTYSSGDISWDMGAAPVVTNTCGLRFLDLDTTTAANQDIYDNIVLSTGSDYTDLAIGNTDCQSTGVKTINFDAGDLTVLEGDTDGTLDLGYRIEGSRTGSVQYTADNSFDSVTLTIEWTAPPPIPTPDKVDDLISTGETYGSVSLAWTEPPLNTGNLTGYQINYTTPYGDPITIITNNTGTSTPSSLVSDLTLGTPYSFRVSAWTEGGNNATGNILNVTTVGGFEFGTAAFNQTNTEVLPITFEEQSINSTSSFLNVTFANTYNLACDFNYRFANINQTYTGLTSYPVSSTLDETSFQFNDVNNEIIYVNCWDQTTLDDADYIMTVTDFPLLTQIQDFRAGEFGTEGKFGIIDVVTLFVIIISMIGLNRVNESVGAIFNIMFLGGLAYFEIIELPTIIFGAIAVVLVFVITSTRKT